MSYTTMELKQAALRKILRTEYAWHWTGKGKKKAPTTIDYEAVNVAYEGYLEWYLQEVVALPAMWRSQVLFKAIKSGGPFKDLDYVESHFSTMVADGEERVVIDCEVCSEQLQYQIFQSGWKGAHRTTYIDWVIWQHPEYQITEVTKEEIDALGITSPEFEHQKSMF